MLQRTRIPLEVLGLLNGMDGGNSAFSLIASNDPRFVDDLPLKAFAQCRMPEEARAGLLLYAGFGAESHAASQNLKSREGNYWHGIHHRMEPDAFNAKYWFARVGPHEIGPSLAEAAKRAGWDCGRNWDHARFVDFVEEGKTPRAGIAEAVQLAEWQLLFEFCAAGKNT